MTLPIQFWIRENGNGTYCQGYWPDPSDIILVTQRPDDSIYNWNIPSQTWITTLALKQQWIRPIRDIELERTDIYMLSDLWESFNTNEQILIVTYRQSLRDAPDHGTIEEIVMPICPDCIRE